MPRAQTSKGRSGAAKATRETKAKKENKEPKPAAKKGVPPKEVGNRTPVPLDGSETPNPPTLHRATEDLHSSWQNGELETPAAMKEEMSMTMNMNPSSSSGKNNEDAAMGGFSPKPEDTTEEVRGVSHPEKAPALHSEQAHMSALRNTQWGCPDKKEKVAAAMASKRNQQRAGDELDRPAVAAAHIPLGAPILSAAQLGQQQQQQHLDQRENSRMDRDTTSNKKSALPKGAHEEIGPAAVKQAAADVLKRMAELEESSDDSGDEAGTDDEDSITEESDRADKTQTNSLSGDSGAGEPQSAVGRVHERVDETETTPGSTSTLPGDHREDGRQSDSVSSPKNDRQVHNNEFAHESESVNKARCSLATNEVASTPKTPPREAILPNASWPSINSMVGTPYTSGDYGQPAELMTPAAATVDSWKHDYELTSLADSRRVELPTGKFDAHDTRVADSLLSGVTSIDDQKDDGVSRQNENRPAEMQDTVKPQAALFGDHDEPTSPHQSHSAQNSSPINTSPRADDKSTKGLEVPPYETAVSTMTAKKNKNHVGAPLSVKALPGSILGRPDATTAKPTACDTPVGASTPLEKAQPVPSTGTKNGAKNVRVVSSPAHSVQTKTTAAASVEKTPTTSLTSTPETQKHGNSHIVLEGSVNGRKPKLLPSAKSKSKSRVSPTNRQEETVSKDERKPSPRTENVTATDITTAGNKEGQKSPATSDSTASRNDKKKRQQRLGFGSPAPALKPSRSDSIPSEKSQSKPKPAVANANLQLGTNESAANRDSTCTVVSSDPTPGGTNAKLSTVAGAGATDSVSSHRKAPIPPLSESGQGNRNIPKLSTSLTQATASPDTRSPVDDNVVRYGGASAILHNQFQSPPANADIQKDSLPSNLYSDSNTKKQEDRQARSSGNVHNERHLSANTEQEDMQARSSVKGSSPRSTDTDRRTSDTPASNALSNITSVAHLPASRTIGSEFTSKLAQVSNSPQGLGQSTVEDPPRAVVNVDSEFSERSASRVCESTIVSTEDEDPSRAVNPLLGLYPLVPDELVARDISEILQLTAISHPKPDTYPLAYYARLLGFAPPRLSSDNSHETDNIICEDICSKYPPPEDRTIHAIPRPGKLFSMWGHQQRRFSGENIPEDDIDPLYKTFLLDGWDDSSLGDPLHGSLLHFANGPLRNCDFAKPYVEQACDFKLLSPGSWTFEYVVPGGKQQNLWSVKACEVSQTRGHPRVLNLNYGLRQYRDNTTSTLASSSKLVVRIYDAPADVSKMGKDSTLQTVLLLLYALALEHGRACEANYCLLEANPAVSELLRARFRMDNVPREFRSSESEFGSCQIRFVCDLHKCSTKYALLQQLEAHCAKTPASCIDQKERLLVSVPAADAKRFVVRRVVAQQAKRSPQEVEQEQERFIGAKREKARNAFLGVRVKRIASSPQSDLLMHFTDETGAEEQAIDTDSGQWPAPDWRILKAFPVPVDSQSENSGPQTNGIVDDLKSLQGELRRQESELHESICSLLHCVADERKVYEHESMAGNREKSRKTLEKYEERFSAQDVGRTWKQNEDDMECVCCVCNDGEVTPQNRIVFCEECEIAVHQRCYRIDEVPHGHYFCRPCQHARESSATTGGSDGVAQDVGSSSTLVCELCPLPGGAFKRLENSRRDPQGPPKWVHVVCAKWQKLELAKPISRDLYENAAATINEFRTKGVQCSLCLSTRGAFSECQVKGCDEHMHVTCARASRQCTVVDRETVGSLREHIGSKIFCRDHSTGITDDMLDDAVPVEDLVRYAEGFPSDPSFGRLPSAEQVEALSNPEYEKNFFRELECVHSGRKCDVCDAQWGKDLLLCSDCNTGVCDTCTEMSENTRNRGVSKGKRLCGGCLHIASKSTTREGYKTPQCTVCPLKDGWLRKALAKPKADKASWFEENPNERANSLFATDLWCHTICSRTHIARELQDTEHGVVDLSKVVLKSGTSFTGQNKVCNLCGHSRGLKKKCTKCNKNGCFFHPTCARQAGFTVAAPLLGGKTIEVRCLVHSSTENNLRAKIENFLVNEAHRIETKGAQMTYIDASKLLNAAIEIMRILGWAWRWEELWVKKNFNWESYIPAMKEGETEDDYTDEDKRVFDSTRASRLADSRGSLLPDFGAALRNRNYDTPGGFDNRSLSRAIKAVLAKGSIVGPLKESERQLLMEWLPRAYRSKSKLLGFGENKIEIGEAKFCYVGKNRTPKFELGDRLLPGKVELMCEAESLPAESNELAAKESVVSPPTAIRRRSTAAPKETSLTKDQQIRALAKQPTGNGEAEDKSTSSVEQERGFPSQTSQIGHARKSVGVSEQADGATRRSLRARLRSRKRGAGEVVSEFPQEAAAGQSTQPPKKTAKLQEFHRPEDTSLLADKSQVILQGTEGESRDECHGNKKRPIERSNDNQGSRKRLPPNPNDDERESRVEVQEHKEAAHDDTNGDEDEEEKEKDSPKYQLQDSCDEDEDEEDDSICESTESDESAQSKHTHRSRVVCHEDRQEAHEAKRKTQDVRFATYKPAGAVSVAGRSSVGGLSNKPQPPLKDMHATPKISRKGRFGVKGNSISANDIDDGASGVDELTSLAGRSIHYEHIADAVSVLTHLTHHTVKFATADVKELENAMKKDFNATRQDKLLTEHNTGHHCERVEGIRMPCLVCCATCEECGTAGAGHERTGCKTRMGCKECYLEIFESKNKCLIDRENIPKQLQEKAVYLCTEARQDDDDALSCFDLWHSANSLPKLGCPVLPRADGPLVPPKADGPLVLPKADGPLVLPKADGMDPNCSCM